ncbi:hypothetical protein GS429_10670 [Natronorubrum sp. JWXQ-INN-674]|uniref:DUF2795 domain-containing protein n=1 Tax=Natronorubrum halalkaliphilum TaxID=2691917 RepID=A0A6B0VNE2_9EURY|nr:hypothetical protein [Natronorubrum halalkaliphilum]MXV62516.1 hypothetical protein [Natronorubrum halalkaliphilum]
MDQSVKLNNIESVLEEFEYPIARDEVCDRCDDVTLVLAEGDANLGEVVANSNDDRFESVDDLKTEVFTLLPRNAVGEPFQSEGEG